MRLILASKSPRRKELLSKAGISFEVMASSIEESYTSTEPAEIAKEISLKKAADVANTLIEAHDKSDFLLLSADTIVVIDGEILGKPENEEEAFTMLHRLQNRRHAVITGVAIGCRRDGGDIIYKQFHEETEVLFFPISDDEIRDYIATGEPMDKAGSYAIQGIFAKHVKAIYGDYTNVVGLPIGQVYRAIREFDK